MPNFAVIKHNIVENCIVADSLEDAKKTTGLECVEYTDDSPVSIGWQYVAGVYSPEVDLPPNN